MIHPSIYFIIRFSPVHRTISDVEIVMLTLYQTENMFISTVIDK